jgi:hypothetical protein
MHAKSRKKLRPERLIAAAIAGTLLVTVLGPGTGTASPPAPAAGQAAQPSTSDAEAAAPQVVRQPACATVTTPGQAGCAVVLTGTVPAAMVASESPDGADPTAGLDTLRPFTAADLQEAYNLPSGLLGGRQTIAVVNPFDYPTAEQDLAVYREANGLPPCGEEFRCLRKFDQRGGTDYPRGDPGWAATAAIQLQMATAACPNCQLLLVEADTATFNDLAAAVDTAAGLGADVISNGYRGFEFPGVPELAAHYDHPGVVITAPSGNLGFAGESLGAAGMREYAPAVFSTVVAVGGTTLARDDNARGWSETAWGFQGGAGWSGSDSGCSVYVAKPRWQFDRLCGDRRTVNDVAAVADQRTPVAIYDSFGYPGWIEAAGTSVSAALIAGVYALASDAGPVDPARHLYANARELFDITSGSTGHCGGRDHPLCTAVPGYDGPTGLGTPNGIGAFRR